LFIAENLYMKYADWNRLTDDEKKTKHWRHHPRIRIATIFSILFTVFFLVVMLRVLQNRRVHVNRKPNALEAFTIAKAFVTDSLKQPGTANFPKSKFESKIDTASNQYQVSSIVDAQDSSGRIVKSNWNIKLSYTGGDWADKKSWKLESLNIAQ
jgi:predicted SAM-dependent methyltransferase